MKRTGQCNQCGKCCKLIKFTLSLSEQVGANASIKEIEEYIRWIEEHRIDVERDRDTLKITIDATCDYLVIDGSCMRHNNKFELCKKFPGRPTGIQSCGYNFIKE